MIYERFYREKDKYLDKLITQQIEALNQILSEAMFQA